jgi:hypothetical protein
MQLVRRILILTIENGWEVGHGPGGLAYSALSEEDFWFNGFFDELLFGSRDELLNGLIEDDLNGSIGRTASRIDGG